MVFLAAGAFHAFQVLSVKSVSSKFVATHLVRRFLFRGRMRFALHRVGSRRMVNAIEIGVETMNKKTSNDRLIRYIVMGKSKFHRS